MSYPYSTYMSPLDSLVFDNVGETAYTETDAAEELALWSNAQFTFDVQPGSGILTDEKPAEMASSSCLTPGGEMDAATYEKLVNYLDYELPRQQQQREQENNASVIPPSFPTNASTPLPMTPSMVASVNPMPQPNVSRHVRHPLLLPKPPVVDGTQPAALVGQINTPAPAVPKPARKKSTPTKRSLSDAQLPEDQLAAEEDKRRRNTAASARFRIKKKLREQAMEQNVREMTAKSEALQNRVNELEKEVKWLRGLLIEKNKGKDEPLPFNA